jgi:response regulator RpfG family c-di-GMP phosphodiesterase
MTNQLPAILYIDDEVINLKLFTIAYKNQLNIYTATSAMEGLEILKNVPISVIVTDYKMPGMDGIELIEKIKTDTPEKVCILVTGYVHELKMNNKSYVYGILNKPWKREELWALIEGAFQLCCNVV